MKFEELTAEQQKLLATDFGPEIEKQAQEEAAVVNEMYSMGHDKLATETADELDKLAEKKDDEEEEEKLPEEEEKKAGELANFIERGFFDGLKKLGSERHGDENAYINLFVAEKLAQSGQQEKAAAVMDKAKKMFGKENMGHMKNKAKELAMKHKGHAAAAAGGGAAGFMAGRGSKK